MTGYFSRLARQTWTSTTSRYESDNQRDNLSPEINSIDEVSDTPIFVSEEKMTDDLPKKDPTRVTDDFNIPTGDSIKTVDDKAQTVEHSAEKFDSKVVPTRSDSPVIADKEVIKADDKSQTVEHEEEKFDSKVVPTRSDSPAIADKEVIKVDEKALIAEGLGVETKPDYTYTSKIAGAESENVKSSSIPSQDTKKVANNPVTIDDKDFRPELLYKELSEWLSSISSQNKYQEKDQNKKDTKQPVQLAKASTIFDTPAIVTTNERAAEEFEGKKSHLQDYGLSIGTISVNVVAPPNSEDTNLSVKTQDKREFNAMSNDKSRSRLSRYYIRPK